MIEKIIVIPIAIILFCMGCVKRTNVNGSTPGDEIVIDKNEFNKLAKHRFDTRDSAMAASRFNSPMIHPGDQLTLSLYEKLPVSLDKRVEIKRVNEQGTIILPPIGIIKLGGLTLTEAAKNIEESFREFVVTPYCEIEITQKGYQPLIYVFGEVGSSGAYALKGGDRLLDAISSAGGCQGNAYRRSIKVIRQYGNKVGMLSINLVDIMDKGTTSENLPLQDQDIIFVPRRFYTSFHEVMSVLSTLSPWYYFIRNM